LPCGEWKERGVTYEARGPAQELVTGTGIMERENAYLGVGTPNGSPTSSYPPSYRSEWQTNSKLGEKEPEVHVRLVQLAR